MREGHGGKGHGGKEHGGKEHGGKGHAGKGHGGGSRRRGPARRASSAARRQGPEPAVVAIGVGLAAAALISVVAIVRGGDAAKALPEQARSTEPAVSEAAPRSPGPRAATPPASTTTDRGEAEREVDPARDVPEARARGDAPGAPAVPARGFLFRPSIAVTDCDPHVAGHAFAVQVDDPGTTDPSTGRPRQVVLVLTALHLFGPSGGFGEQPTGAQLPDVVEMFTLLDPADPERVLGEGGPALSMPEARTMAQDDEAGAGDDLAAFRVEHGVDALRPLQLDCRRPEVGERVWMHAQVQGEPDARLHAGTVTESADLDFTVAFDEPVELQATSGAPWLDADGQVIGINIGSVEDGAGRELALVGGMFRGIEHLYEGLLPGSVPPVQIEIRPRYRDRDEPPAGGRFGRPR